MNGEKSTMTPMQCRMARAGLEWSARQLASRAGIGVNTVARFEQGNEVLHGTVRKLRTVLESEGVTFGQDGTTVTVRPSGGLASA